MNRAARRAVDHSSWCAFLLACFAGCALGSEPAAAETAELPVGWEKAWRVEGLMQPPCRESALLPEARSRMILGANRGALAVAYDAAQFRCAQEVEAFLRSESARLDVLIQPVDMSPTQVAGCDCLYDISFDVPLERGSYAFTLYRRWDNLNDSNEPVEVGRAHVSLP
jgi:hypothetical protein